jgi:hypothetical protein
MVGLVDLDQEKRRWFLYSGKTEKFDLDQEKRRWFLYSGKTEKYRVL